MSIKLISFDAWKTLVDANKAYARARAILILEAIGYVGDLETGIALVRQAAKDLDARTDDTGLQYGFEPRVQRACRLLNLPELGQDLLARVATEALELHLKMLPSLMEPTLPETFQALRAAGLKLAVISNTGFTNGETLSQALRALGLTFDHELYSDQLGYAKPSPAIFGRLVEESGCQPDEILHVGDNVKADLEGAIAAGLNALVYDPQDRLGHERSYRGHTDLLGQVRRLDSVSVS